MAGARILVLANPTVGSGKTTSAVNLAATLALQGWRTLLVDADVRGGLTTGLGLGRLVQRPLLLDVLCGQGLDLRETSLAVPGLPFDVAPGGPGLPHGRAARFDAAGDLHTLARALGPELRAHYDLIVLDTGPSLGLLTLNALVAAEGLAVPVAVPAPAERGLRALERSLRALGRVRCRIPRRLGILPVFCDPTRDLGANHASLFEAAGLGPLFSVRVPVVAMATDLPPLRHPAVLTGRPAPVAEAYRRWAGEVLARLGAGPIATRAA
jgi:chromosome partitioning protein